MSERGHRPPWYQRPFGLPELQDAARLAHPYRMRTAREVPALQAAAVLILFSPDGREVLITKRTESVETHKGQYAFPGGRLEVGETAEQAVLRESFEEVGLAPEDVRLAGQLPELLTVTGYRVQPFLGMLARSVKEVTLAAQESETAEIIWASAQELFHPVAYRIEEVEYQGRFYPVEVFYLGERRIWGATAAMLGNTAGRLEEILK